MWQTPFMTDLVPGFTSQWTKVRLRISSDPAVGGGNFGGKSAKKACPSPSADMQLPPMPRGKTVAVARREARMYLRKAGQFLEEAHEAVAAERHDACLLNAIHAAISAADAVTVVLAGRRSADPDHQRAADLLEEMGASTPASKERVRQLRALVLGAPPTPPVAVPSLASFVTPCDNAAE